MDSDCDKHVCLRCGITILGLGNYVTHRQQKCFKVSEKIESPLLSEGSDILPCVDSSTKDDLQNSSFSPSDIDKLSADDFFLSLNLQNIANIGGGSQRTLSSVSDGFCAKLCFPTLETDLDPAFSDDKDFLSETIINDSNSMTIDNLIDSNHNDCQENFSLELSNNFFLDKNVCKTQVKSALMQNLRTSLRRAEKTSLCCETINKPRVCPFCQLTFIFSSTLLNHSKICEIKLSNASNKKSLDVMRQESMPTREFQFTCKLCSFNSDDSVSFLEHLKHKTHCHKAAILKHPLICLPCEIECSGSDEMRTHFSKFHLKVSSELHPISVSERKKNLHCCYCLRITNSCHYFLMHNSGDCVQMDDAKTLKASIKAVSKCAYGVEKTSLSSYLTVLKSLPSATDSELTSEENFCLNSLKKMKDLKNIYNFRVASGKPKKAMNKKNLKSKNICPSKLKVDDNQDCLHEIDASSIKKVKFNTVDKVRKRKKKFLCEICGYSTEIFHHLTKHKRYHTGEKPFKCKECGISFAVCSQLLRHKRLHSGAKPYKCPYCSYTCNTQENLRKHILKTKKHAGKKMYPCKHCTFECNEFSDYRNHLLNEHSDNFPDNKHIFSSAVAGLYEMLQT